MIGVFPGKFTPPHRGHIAAIIAASCQVNKLYVVVSHNTDFERELYKDTFVKPITMKQKIKWLSIELSEFEHIKVVGLDEGKIPIYPEGWLHWSQLLNKAVPEKFNVIFGGEPEYGEQGYTKMFPHCEYRCYDKKLYDPISATTIRDNPYEHWEYILGAAREHFVKKVLITGTESCGKTTLTKMLAKIFFTSWAREEGRYYSTKYFGGNEGVFEKEDFYKIAWEQRLLEDHAIRTANRIVFFDTDAVVTQFYCEQYLGVHNPLIESLINSNRYDLILMCTPDVPWVADGFRWNSDDHVRWELHKDLLNMYNSRKGFHNKIVTINDTYSERLNKATEVSKTLMNLDYVLRKQKEWTEG